MAEDVLSLKTRPATRQRRCLLRETGQIPSVVYGKGEPILTASDYNATQKVLKAVGYHSPVNLEIEGKKQLAIVKRVAICPVSRRIINIQFQAISKNQEVEAITPITVINFEESAANQQHLALLQVLEELELKAKPDDLPSEITVDAKELSAVGDKITVGDLTLPKGVELANLELAPETVVVNVYDPAAEAAIRSAEEETDMAEAAADTAANDHAADQSADKTPKETAE